MGATMRISWKTLALACSLIVTTASSAGAADVIFPSWQWGESANAKFLGELKQRFETKYPGDKVQGVTVPFDGFFDKQMSEVKAGSPPDIVTLFDADMAAYAKAGLLEPLDKYLASAGVKLSQLIGVHKLAVVDGHIYGIVFQQNPRALIMNGTMLRNAGLAVPRTLDDLYSDIKALRDPIKHTFGFASLATSGSSQDEYLAIAPVVFGFGGQFFTAGKPTANSPQTIAALTFLKKLYDENLVPRVASNTSRQMFIDGKLAMQINGPYLVGFTEQQNKATFQAIETTPLPLPGNRTIAVSVFLAMPKAAAHKDTAGRLIETLLEPDMQRQVIEIVKALPAVNGSVPPQFEAQNPWFAAFAQAGKSAVSFAPEGVEQYGPELYNIIGPAVDDILFNGQPVTQVADRLQHDLEKFLADKNAK
jgi:multiple sugar transport system substrate-binding protein